MYTGTGTLRAANGHSVHKVVPLRRDGNEEGKPRADTVPIAERYQDLAAHIHRTAIAPRGDRYIWGCVCGAVGVVTDPGYANADLTARKHVIDEAAKLYDMLEGNNLNNEPNA